MKRVIAILGALFLVAAFTLPAMADVNILGTITKTKSKNVTENVFIDKAHYIGVKQVVKPSHSAEAQALKNDVSTGNSVIETYISGTPGAPPEYWDDPITGERFVLNAGTAATPGKAVQKTATIDGGSLDSAAGIVNVNQAPGSINNQGNAASVSFSAAAQPVTEVVYAAEGETRFIGGAFLHAESSAEKILTANIMNAERTIRSNTIDGAMVGISGIVGANQSAGNMNNQNNAVALAVGDGIASLTEADLGMTSTGNNSIELATVTTDSLTNGALNGAAGIIGVNQSSGVLNNQANVVAAAVVTFNAVSP